MDLSKLTSTLLSSDTLKGLSSLTGASKSDVSSVLTSALPALLNGANTQAKDESTTEGFANALAQHAKDDTSNLSSFLSNIDLTDGSKIISHLLGSDESSVTKAVAKDSGVSSENTNKILSAAGPLLMSLLGQQADEDENKESGVGALFGSLLDNVDIGSVLGAVTGTSTTSSGSTSTQAASSAKSGLGGILSGLLGKLFKK